MTLKVQLSRFIGALLRCYVTMTKMFCNLCRNTARFRCNARFLRKHVTGIIAYILVTI
jgi:hypothetical protein